MNVDKEPMGNEMYDMIASWMTSGGPLQELRRDDRGVIRPEPGECKPATEPVRRTHRPTFAFARWPGATRSPMTSPCVDGCAAC